MIFFKLLKLWSLVCAGHGFVFIDNFWGRKPCRPADVDGLAVVGPKRREERPFEVCAGVGAEWRPRQETNGAGSRTESFSNWIFLIISDNWIIAHPLHVLHFSWNEREWASQKVRAFIAKCNVFTRLGGQLLSIMTGSATAIIWISGVVLG